MKVGVKLLICILAVSFLLASCDGPKKLCESGLGVEFESQTAGTNYVIGDNFDENNITVAFETFVDILFNPVPSGMATIQTDGDAGGSGNEIWMNNITTRFISPCLIHNLTLYYGAHGGNLNMEVNGEFFNFDNPLDVDGKSWPGATTHITDLGGGLGILTIRGEIWSFAFGGQELAIDVFCPDEIECAAACKEVCVDFESQPLGSGYKVFDFFTENHVTVSFQTFIESSGAPATKGFAEIQDLGDAGGSGNELMDNNINTRFTFPCEVEYIMLRFGEYGGTLNIEINGNFVNFDDFQDINGTIIGGVNVNVPVGGFGDDQGILELDGKVNSFMIGGQELILDDVCTFGY
jgi:hypothetical protein